MCQENETQLPLKGNAGRTWGGVKSPETPSPVQEGDPPETWGSGPLRHGPWDGVDKDGLGLPVGRWDHSEGPSRSGPTAPPRENDPT